MPAKKTSAKRGRRPASRRRAESKATSGPGSVFLIDMIPKSISDESAQDSEPHLTVNPANPKQIVGTAFTPDPAGGAMAPIYISSDAGQTWKLNSIVPSVAASIGTGDITTGFSGKATTLYAGILNAGTFNLQFLRTPNPFLPNPMTILADRPDADQPFTIATKKGLKELVYIGDNDFNAPAGKTATVDESLTAGVPPPAFTSVRVAQRTTPCQDAPPPR